MAGFLDDLNYEQVEMTVAALEEYIIDTADTDMNMAMGIRTALARYIRERLDFLGVHVIPDVKLGLDEDENFEDTDTAFLVNVLKAMQKKVDNIRIGE